MVRVHGCHFGHPCSRAVLVKSIVVMMWVDLFFSSDSSDDDDDNVVVVKTSVGEVRGRVVSASFGHVTDVTVDQYLGIPFAVPPVGQLRYADPVPLDRLPSGTLTPLRGLLGRDYAVTGQLADTPTRGLPTRGLDISWTGQLADYRQLAH